MKNAMAKHIHVFHPDQTPDFTSKILGKYKYNMTRYIAESLFIEKFTRQTQTRVINQKSEWGRQKLTRLTLTDNTEQ